MTLTNVPRLKVNITSKNPKFALFEIISWDRKPRLISKGGIIIALYCTAKSAEWFNRHNKPIRIKFAFGLDTFTYI